MTVDSPPIASDEFTDDQKTIEAVPANLEHHEDRQGPFQGVSIIYQVVRTSDGKNLLRFSAQDSHLAKFVAAARIGWPFAIARARELQSEVRKWMVAAHSAGEVGIELVDSLKAKIAEKDREIERLKDVLHRDQTGLAHALAQVTEKVKGYEWVTQSRGPYEWDDDEYRKEMGRMLDAIKKISTEGLEASGKLAHRECCGRNTERQP